MKNTTKILAGIFLTMTLYSCSTESEENTGTALQQELQMENKGVLQIGSTTYIFKSTGETSKFLNETKEFDFKFTEELIYTSEEEVKHAVEGLIITNPETEEFIKFTNFHALKNNKVQFDLELSTGDKLYSVIYKPGAGLNANERWHDDWPVMTPQVFGSVIESSQDGLSDNCKAAIDACKRGGGKATVTLTNNHRWFSTPATCNVGCN